MNDKQFLTNLLAGLKASKAALDSQIALIEQRIDETVAPVVLPPTKPLTLADDPTILGVDSLGRIIRKRTFTPETLKKKQDLMRAVRQKRVQELEELRRFKAQHGKLR